jgi:hypothetical protein
MVSPATIAKLIHSQMKVLLGLWLFMLNLNTKIMKFFQAVIQNRASAFTSREFSKFKEAERKAIPIAP